MRPGEQYKFKIAAYTPEIIPMARLAEYLAQLAEILGEKTAVHFVRLEAGSTVVVSKVEAEAIPKVRRRAASVRRRDAPRDALRAYDKVNRMLRDDNGSAVLEEETTGAEIIAFPGRETEHEQFSGVHQRGALDGEIIKVGGPRPWVPVMLQSEDQEIAGLWARRPLAKQLAPRLFEPIRVFGMGTWARDEDGKWNLDRFVIDSFVPLRDETLSDAIARINAVAGDWGGTPVSELEKVRGEQGNGGL